MEVPIMGQVAKTEEEMRQARLEALLAQHLLRPATINSIEIHGVKNTRRGFLDPLVSPLIAGTRNAVTTFGDVLKSLNDLTQKLERFDIYKTNPEISIADARDSNPHAAATDLDIAIGVAEKSRLMLKAGTDVGNTEGSAYTNALLRNLFGGGESLSFNASAGTRTRSAYIAAFSTPVNSNPDVVFTVDGVASATQKPWLSHEEVLKGGSIKLAWRTRAGDRHGLGYSGTWRQVTGLSQLASATVRADAGDSVKSAIAHTFVRDRRDTPLLPQSGYMVRTSSELAGIGPLKGDVACAKSELEVALATRVPIPGIQGRSRGSVGAGLRLGALYPLALGWDFRAPARPSRVTDRFQLGGPTDVRGFRIGGLGPHDGMDATGGDIFAAASLNALLPVPRTSLDSPLRLQLFVNGGRLLALGGKGKQREHPSEPLTSGEVWTGMKSALCELTNGLPSTAAGVGLVYAHSLARFELNLSLPLVLRRGEDGRKGLQVGVGIDFL